jgi:hypothetical protein
MRSLLSWGATDTNSHRRQVQHPNCCATLHTLKADSVQSAALSRITRSCHLPLSDAISATQQLASWIKALLSIHRHMVQP